MNIKRRQAQPVDFFTLVTWLQQRAGGLYGGEAITQLEHALQCASQAQREGATDALVVAALLHDIAHLADNETDETFPHGEMAAQLLSELFHTDVTEPIRLHVEAKRYLCAADPLYWSGLSPASQRSLIWQGGPYSVAQATEFMNMPYAEDAVRLRLWDDAAKVIDAVTPDLDHFIALMEEIRLPQQVIQLQTATV
ncbi:HD domain-containing protein [Undibacterium sp. CY18W]|uniref:HD domain-containing protein n=1 Tax=Undibacterium hunanense TaxID=2762292 RepID=A0ABR6ZMD4_9BURK|nr:HD domain-containing protein [Undibacterium hunanense]MBC3917042.1 HD domain-containing protein [Undibacterium hunanense]